MEILSGEYDEDGLCTRKKEREREAEVSRRAQRHISQGGKMSDEEKEKEKVVGRLGKITETIEKRSHS